MRMMFDVDAVLIADGAWRGRVIAWRGPTSRGWPHWTARTYWTNEEAFDAALRLRDFLIQYPGQIRGRR